MEDETTPGFKKGSIYVIAKGSDTIIKKHAQTPSAPESQELQSNLDKLNQILQLNGFIETDFDEAATIAVDQNHQRMHAAVCALCEGAAEQKPAHLTDVQAYEAAQSAMIDGLNALRQRVVDAILHFDALTGLPLRNGLEYAFHIRRKDAIRQGVPLYVAMIDVDFFKRINDTWGHPVGDLALQHLARLMTACLRDNDIAVRYGGEEFLFLLLGHEAEKVTQRILEEVRQHPMPMEGSMALPMTVTAGLTVVSPSDSLASAVDRAD